MERLIVAKVGTNVLTREVKPGEPNRMDLNVMMDLARDIGDIRKETGHAVVLVTSGAVGFGNEKKDLKRKLAGIYDPVKVKQVLAAYGQRRLMDKWSYAFAQATPPRDVAQFLITHNNLADKSELADMLGTMGIVLEEGDIPVINENDAVAAKEIKFGDNDQLASRLAVAAGAEVLVLLTDVNGVSDKDPARYPDARLLKTINAGSITKHFIGDAELNGQRPFRLEIAVENGNMVVLMSDAGGNTNGTGGIASKVDAGKSFVEKTGKSAVIAHGKNAGVLGRIVHGESEGTVILPE